jgi:hypothetical protein
MMYTIVQYPSPNHGPRGGHDISMIVLHATVGSFKSSLDWLRNPQKDNPDDRVSTHYLIRKDGYIAQLVQDEQAAWHAGRARWHGLTDINAVSLGIELENANNGRDPYPPAQLASAHWLCQDKIARYNIERADVVRHLDIAIPKGRKTDPAGFPWPLFADSLYMDAPPLPPPQSPVPSPLRHYRVKASVTGGATIRSAPSKAGAVLGRLAAGDSWVGEPVLGQQIYIAGFGSSAIWIRSMDQRCVWSGLLEEVKA